MIGLDSANQIGVAPDAQWCACRNMERGWGTPFTYLECFEWFLAPTDLNNENPDPAKAPHVINNSWSCPQAEGCDSSNWMLLDMAVNNLRLAGTVVVVSAGNSGSGCGSVSTPAAMFEGSFSVGATRENDTIAGFSSRGPVFVDGSLRLKPNVSAPGTNVRSSFPGGSYGHASGTSMAGPHVAGLVALVISANPELAGQVELIEDIIEQTAVPKTTDQQCGDVPGSEVPNAVYGYGRVDALAAVEAALALIETSTETLVPDHALRITPNPASDMITISLPQDGENITLQLFDPHGRQVLAQTRINPTASQAQISLTDLPPGLYIVHAKTADGVRVGKFIKQ
jgi:subtilisin family serine protease